MKIEDILRNLAEEIKIDMRIRNDFLIDLRLAYPKRWEFCCRCEQLASGYRGIYGSFTLK